MTSPVVLPDSVYDALAAVLLAEADRAASEDEAGDAA